MALYHKWDVKNGFAYVLQFFSLISDGLGGVFCMRQFPRSEFSQRNRRQWNSGRIFETFLKPSGPQVESRSILGADGFGHLLARSKEIVERRYGEPIEFLFLPKMGLLGSQASNEKNFGYEL